MADSQLGPLLEPLFEGRDPSGIVVLTSDHGESLGDHGEQTHGTFAYDSTLHIPLVFWAPSLLTPGTEGTSARHVDIVPTILDLIGEKPAEDLPGWSLFSPIPAGRDSGSYFEALAPFLNRGWAPLHGRIEANLKAIRLPIPELYDLRQDPRETLNLGARSPEPLKGILAKLPVESETLPKRNGIDEETLRRLRSLGYVASNRNAEAGSENDESRDPKRLIELEPLLDGAVTSYRDGDIETALRVLRSLLDRQPEMAIAYVHLASILIDTGRTSEAITLLNSALARGVSSEPIRRSLALGLLRSGLSEKAWQVLREDDQSQDPETHAALGRIAAALGRFEDAAAQFEEALRIDPTYPAVRVDMATMKMMRGRFKEARAELEEAVSRDPFLAEGWNALGVIRSKAGDAKGAVEAWETAVDADSRLPDALFNLAMARAEMGEYGKAVECLLRYIPLVGGEDRRRAEAVLERFRRAAQRAMAGKGSA